MPFDPEVVRLAATFCIYCAGLAAITKISHECSADRLRRELREIELDLFEAARWRRLFLEPAYRLLNHELRRAIREASRIRWQRRAWDAFRPEANGMPLLTDATARAEARACVRDEVSRMCIQGLEERACAAVRLHFWLGAIPFASALVGWICSWHRAGMPYFLPQRQAFEGPAVRRARLPRAA